LFENKQNYLTKDKYRDLLWIIGTSSKPLTTYQIKEKLEEKKEFAKTSSPYVYEMIKKLHVGFIDSHFQYIFNWDKITKNKNHKKRLLDYFKNILKIDLDYYYDDIDDIKIVDTGNNIIQIEIDYDKKILMKKHSPHFVDVLYTNKNKTDSFSFLIKDRNKICSPSSIMKNELESFIDLFYTKSILFLDKELKPKYQNVINQKRDIYKNLESQTAKEELNREIEEIFMNNELYVYSLNIRGLILYILAEIYSENKNNSDENKVKKRRKNYNLQISRVIDNLAEHYSKKFPFLYNYREIKTIIGKIKSSKHFDKHYEVQILRKIAEELKHQIYFDEKYTNLDLDFNNNSMINYWITKRYFTEIYHYFAYLYKFLDDEKKNEYNLLIRDFKEKMLILMKEYLEKEEQSIRYLLYE
jgi:hypothetical protein